ncbi:hypothetical protein APA58_34165 [Pseudomonas aeruginosa]|nr:hypothetical protein APA58_34165 [Pseudomonas aeruginosa]
MGTTDLNGGALFNAEFGIRHRGSTVPERSGVALSFCRRRCFDHKRIRWGFFRVKLGERRTVVHLEGGGIESYTK